MLQKALKSLFGSRNDRLIKRLRKTVELINAQEKSLSALSEADLKAKTAAFKTRIANGETLDAILPEAFAVCREASKRTLGMRHFDVQLIGGMVLHEGKIAEMSTGEGKTLSATLPVYLNALSGQPVHVVTVNDYLARRDAEWMGPLYEALDLKVGVVVPNMTTPQKHDAYAADVIYATNNELGFDYLRDRMAFRKEDQVQTALSFAIVDEVDSILIDEARTPLIISGAAEDSSALYQLINDKVMPVITEVGEAGDYTLDEKSKQAYLTEQGHQKVETSLHQLGLLPDGASLYDPQHITMMHHITAGLRAHTLFKRDVDYLVADNQVVIVDEHTGRTMPGRRWSDGLHQAVEAKERVAIQQENQTLASITFQNYFRLYGKLAGMTGTADTEAFEFHQIYGLEVVVIPTNKPCARDDKADLIFLSQEEKFDAIVGRIKDAVETKQPVLVGTISIEASEYLAKRLKKEKIKHNVLNAKYHEKEAHIIADAGRPGAVTIATNMAGRGTDIVLGGALDADLKALGETPSDTEIARVKSEWQKRHDTVIQAGGLLILGTERHESRRIDNQLRGRSGRQGDAGESEFYLAMDDNLMRIFASDKMSGLMRKLGVKKGEAITHPWVNRAIENAQRKVEGHHFDVRKQLLQYDDVANDQRRAIYSQRDELLGEDNVSDSITRMQQDVITDKVYQFIPETAVSDMWDIPGCQQSIQAELNLEFDLEAWLNENQDADQTDIIEAIETRLQAAYQEKCRIIPETEAHQIEKSLLLHVLDLHWKEHLASLDALRQSIHLRGYAQKDPKQEYKREAFQLFEYMLSRIKHDVVCALARLDVRPETTQQSEAPPAPQDQKLNYEHASGDVVQSEKSAPAQAERVGRNDQCPCGSGKKYKHCHGVLV